VTHVTNSNGDRAGNVAFDRKTLTFSEKAVPVLVQIINS